MSKPVRRVRNGIGRFLCALNLCALLMLAAAGCGRRPAVLPQDQQIVIDRTLVEYPPGTELKPYITGLTAPSAMTFDNEGSLIIAESGIDGHEPLSYGFKPDGTHFNVYPFGRRLPKFLRFGRDDFRLYGPIGGMTFTNGKLYVTHRDANRRGVVTALGYDGTHQTIVADLPAQGDHAVTDIVLNPRDGRLYFGVGTATNSGVVGLDNMRWLRRQRSVADQTWGNVYLLGRRFDTPNPFSGIFGGADLAVTAPFQPFGKSIETFVPTAQNGKPNGAIYSVDPNGGGLRVEAYGIRFPVGLGFAENTRLYATNQGMKLRGTRPVKDDPDVMLQVLGGQWYGWPDYSANIQPIREEQFLPPVEMIVRSGYRDLSFLIDHQRSGLPVDLSPTNLLAAEFKPLSGAAKFDFAPQSGPFSRLRQGGNIAIVAQWGDRAPYDTGGLRLVGPQGYKIVQVNVDDRQVTEFIRNTRQGPASRYDLDALERPIDVKFGPDGALYILDFGQMEMKKGKERIRGATGKIYRLVALSQQ